MTSEADTLEREIEASRGRLDRTLELLQQRLTPSGVVEDVLGTVRSDPTGAGLYDAAVKAVRRYPVPVLLMCLGAVMLLKGKGRPADYRAVRDPDRLVGADRSGSIEAPVAIPVSRDADINQH